MANCAAMPVASSPSVTSPPGYWRWAASLVASLPLAGWHWAYCLGLVAFAPARWPSAAWPSAGVASAGGGAGGGGGAAGGRGGGIAIGGGAIGGIAIGGGAFGYYAVGGGALGEHVIDGMRQDPEAVRFFGEWLPFPLEFPYRNSRN